LLSFFPFFQRRVQRRVNPAHFNWWRSVAFLQSQVLSITTSGVFFLEILLLRAGRLSLFPFPATPSNLRNDSSGRRFFYEEETNFISCDLFFLATSPPLRLSLCRHYAGVIVNLIDSCPSRPFYDGIIPARITFPLLFRLHFFLLLPCPLVQHFPRSRRPQNLVGPGQFDGVRTCRTCLSLTPPFLRSSQNENSVDSECVFPYAPLTLNNRNRWCAAWQSRPLALPSVLVVYFPSFFLFPSTRWFTTARRERRIFLFWILSPDLPP